MDGSKRGGPRLQGSGDRAAPSEPSRANRHGINNFPGLAIPRRLPSGFLRGGNHTPGRCREVIPDLSAERPPRTGQRRQTTHAFPRPDPAPGGNCGDGGHLSPAAPRISRPARTFALTFLARLVFAHPNEAAAANELEGSPRPGDHVGDVHGRSLADSLGATANPARSFCDECYRRAMTPPPTTPAVSLS